MQVTRTEPVLKSREAQAEEGQVKPGAHVHDDEEDEGDVDVGQGVPPVREDQLVVQVFHLAQRPRDVAEQVVDGLLVGQLDTTHTTP